jgi:hypothetical protein
MDSGVRDALKQSHKSGSSRLPSAPSKPSLDEILLKGGTDPTLFQSIGLFLIGLAFILFAGLPVFVYQYMRPDRRDLQGVLFCAMVSLWGLVMMVNGVVAILRYYRKNGTVAGNRTTT